MVLAGFGSAGCCRAGGVNLTVSKALELKGVRVPYPSYRFLVGYCRFSVVFTDEESSFHWLA